MDVSNNVLCFKGDRKNPRHETLPTRRIKQGRYATEKGKFLAEAATIAAVPKYLVVKNK